ncbi:uncharacterized protein [Paramormyrops kingsleyae]|uniref:uncharacterized protein isoform X2 n=1 Tax=Paramormyrops kingsleyae TaxID=1676925 RepID=UPI003B969F6A
MWNLHLQVYTCLVGLGWSSANHMNYFKELEDRLPQDYLFSIPDISGCCENCCEFRETLRIFSQNTKGSKCEKLFNTSQKIIAMIDRNGKADCPQCNYSSTVLRKVKDFISNFSTILNLDYTCKCPPKNNISSSEMPSSTVYTRTENPTSLVTAATKLPIESEKCVDYTCKCPPKNNISSSEMPSSTVYTGTESPTSLVTAATKLPTVSEIGADYTCKCPPKNNISSSEMPSSTVYTGTENPTSLVTAATNLPTVSEKGDLKYLTVIIVLVLVLLGAICILFYFYNKIKQLNKELKNLKQLVDLDLYMR